MSFSSLLLRNQLSLTEVYTTTVDHNNIWEFDSTNGSIQRLELNDNCIIFINLTNPFNSKLPFNTLLKCILLIENTSTVNVLLNFNLTDKIIINNIPDDGLIIFPNIIYVLDLYSFDNGYTWRVIYSTQYGPNKGYDSLVPNFKNGIQKPIIHPILTPAKQDNFDFPTTSDFKNFDEAIITDYHVSTDYKICKDINGLDCIKSINSTDLLNGQININGIYLESGIEYYIFCRYNGSIFTSEWSDPELLVVVFCHPDTPQIISYDADNYKIFPNSGIMIETTLFSSSTLNDVHVSSSYKVCSDVKGEKIIYQDLNNSTNLTKFTFTDVSLLNTTDFYYVFAKHSSSICGDSDWSDPVLIKVYNGLYSDAGRGLYRHESNMGTVIECYIDGVFTKFMVLDAKYRKFDMIIDEQPSYNHSFPTKSYTNINGNSYIFGSSSISSTPSSNKFYNYSLFTDDFLDNLWKKSYSLPTYSANQIHDYYLNNSSTLNYDIQNKSNTTINYGLYYARSIDINGAHPSLPLIEYVLRIIAESVNLDKLDPTISEFPKYRLSYTTSSAYPILGNIGSSPCYFATITPTTFSSSIYLMISIYCSSSYQGCNYLSINSKYNFICPILELDAPNEYSIKTPTSKFISNINNKLQYFTDFVSTPNQSQDSTIVRVCEDINGKNEIYKEIITDNLTYFDLANKNIPLELDIEYYLFIKYRSKYLSLESDFSQPIVHKYNPKVYYTSMGRKIYRHESGMGSVLEFQGFYKTEKVLILDAQYRGFPILGNSTSYSDRPTEFSDNTINSINSYNKTNSNYLDNVISNNNRGLAYGNPVTTDPPQYTDYQIKWLTRKLLFNSNKLYSSRENCNIYSKYNSYNFVKFCRNKKVYQIACDCPNLEIVIRMVIEMEHIDALDESLHISRTLALGTINSNGIFGNKYSSGLVSSTYYNWTSYTSNFKTTSYANVKYLRLMMSTSSSIQTGAYQFTISGITSGYNSNNSYNYLVSPILELTHFSLDIPELLYISPIVGTDGKKILYVESSKSNLPIIYTNWKITSDVSGLNIIRNDSKSKDLYSHYFLNLDNLLDGTTYYVFVQYYNPICGLSNWSLVRTFKFQSSNITTQSSRKIYRHISEIGTVLEYNDNNVLRKILILDAKYRASGLKFGSTNIPVNLPNFNQSATLTGYIETVPYTPLVNIPRLSDLDLNSKWGSVLDTNIAEYNCTEWLKLNTEIDNDSISGVPAINYCNKLVLNGISAVLPNINDLLRIYFEADNIDNLDPTVNDYSQYRLGININKDAFWQNSYALSSTNYDNLHVRGLSYDGRILKISKNLTIINSTPILIIPIINIISYLIEVPAITINKGEFYV